jgi:hypothetical protein
VLVTSPQFLRHNFRSSDINQLTDSQTQITQGGVGRDEAMTQVFPPRRALRLNLLGEPFLALTGKPFPRTRRQAFPRTRRQE